jgi:hypothetical protein
MNDGRNLGEVDAVGGVQQRAGHEPEYGQNGAVAVEPSQAAPLVDGVACQPVPPRPRHTIAR